MITLKSYANYLVTFYCWGRRHFEFFRMTPRRSGGTNPRLEKFLASELYEDCVIPTWRERSFNHGLFKIFSFQLFWGFFSSVFFSASV